MTSAFASVVRLSAAISGGIAVGILFAGVAGPMLTLLFTGEVNYDRTIPFSVGSIAFFCAFNYFTKLAEMATPKT